MARWRRRNRRSGNCPPGRSGRNAPRVPPRPVDHGRSDGRYPALAACGACRASGRDRGCPIATRRALRGKHMTGVNPALARAVKWLVQIYLLRHGIAENGAPGRPDSERALTDEGKEKLRRVLERARGAGTAPSLILSSPYRRALETAEVAVKVFAYEGKVVKTRALVPEASPYDTWEEIRARAGER